MQGLLRRPITNLRVRNDGMRLESVIMMVQQM
jgi:hypothetical protein